MTQHSEKMEKFRVDHLDHVELFVEDRYEAAAWYRRTLGLETLVEREGWADDPRGPLMISSDGGATMLALFEGRPPGKREIAGFRRVAFRVGGEDFMRFLDHAAKLGLETPQGEKIDRAAAIDHNGAFSVYFQDPWGHLLEVTTYEVEGLAAGTANQP